MDNLHNHRSIPASIGQRPSDTLNCCRFGTGSLIKDLPSRVISITTVRCALLIVVCLRSFERSTIHPGIEQCCKDHDRVFFHFVFKAGPLVMCWHENVVSTARHFVPNRQPTPHDFQWATSTCFPSIPLSHSAVLLPPLHKASQPRAFMHIHSLRHQAHRQK